MASSDEPLFIEALKKGVAVMLRDLQQYGELESFLAEIIFTNINSSSTVAEDVIRFKSIPPRAPAEFLDEQVLSVVLEQTALYLRTIGEYSDAITRSESNRIFKYAALTYIAKIFAITFTYVKFLQITSSTQARISNVNASRTSLRGAEDLDGIKRKSTSIEAMMQAMAKAGKQNAMTTQKAIEEAVRQAKIETQDLIKQLKRKVQALQIKNAELLGSENEVQKENDRLLSELDALKRALDSYVIYTPEDIAKTEQRIQTLVDRIQELDNRLGVQEDGMCDQDELAELRTFKESYYKLTELFNSTVFPLSRFG